jgi:hypothetical protein
MSNKTDFVLLLDSDEAGAKTPILSLLRYGILSQNFLKTNKFGIYMSVPIFRKNVLFHLKQF